MRQMCLRHTAGTVQQPVSGLDGVVNRVGACSIVHLPQTKAHLGHLVAAAQLDGRTHCGRFCIDEASKGIRLVVVMYAGTLQWCSEATGEWTRKAGREKNERSHVHKTRDVGWWE